MSWTDVLEAGAPIVGTVAGGLIGGLPGAMVGGALGSTVGAGVGLFDKPEYMGATQEQKTAYAMTNQANARLSSLNGLSPDAVQRISQLGESQALQSMELVNSAYRNMSAFDRQRLYEEVNNMVKKQSLNITDKIQQLDPYSEAQNLSKQLQGAGLQAQQANAMSVADRNAEQLEKRAREQQLANFKKSIQNVVMASMIGANMKTPKAIAEQNSQDALDKQLATIDEAFKPIEKQDAMSDVSLLDYFMGE